MPPVSKELITVVTLNIEMFQGHRCVQQTDRQTLRPTTERATCVAIDHVYSMCRVYKFISVCFRCYLCVRSLSEKSPTVTIANKFLWGHLVLLYILATLVVTVSWWNVKTDETYFSGFGQFINLQTRT